MSETSIDQARRDQLAGYQLSDRYLRTDGPVLLTGVQALARLPIEQLRRDREAGLDTAAFLSGYPGSPLGGFDQEVARALRLTPELPIVHEPAVNEELGATAVMGSQLAPGRPDAINEGVVGFWYGKAPGLDRAGDALRHGAFAGASPKGGAVVLVGDDPACKSSTMPSSSDATLVDLHMPILYPGTIAECLELGLHAVAMSRATGLWSSMKIVTPIADGSGTVDLPVLAADPVIPTIEIDGKRWECRPSAHFLGPRMLEVEREFREVRLPLATRYGIDNALNRVTADPADAWIGLVATGFTYQQMLAALRQLGLPDERAITDAGIRILQLRMPVPFDADLVRRFARGLEEIVVVEEKNPTLEWLIKDALYGGPDQPLVVGKTHEDGSTLMRAWGMLDADAMVDGLRERLSKRLVDRLAPKPEEPTRELIPLAVNRTPFFCSGCPHNWGTKVPDDALVGAGTGCHGMTLLMDPARVGEGVGITAMGNEGVQWIGMEPFVEADHLFQNYGDGTFFHSAQLALQNCIGAGKHMTFKILYNGTVAMTGGQESTAELGVGELATILLAQGVSKVAITAEDPGRYRSIDLPKGVDVTDRDRIVEVQEHLRATPGVTVLIHDQYCAAELRRGRRRGTLTMPTRRVVINHRVCEGCGDCGDVSNCLSVQPVETPLGRKTTIDQASCNFDESCMKGDCPAFMTVETGGRSGEATSGADAPEVVVADPMPTTPTDLVRIRLAGIGGTGVVTVAQILATAAMFDGWEVRGLDQTGLSQKAGPVISDVVLARPGVGSSNLVGAGQADLLLGFDAMVAASDPSIAGANPERTAVVASTTTTPTGAMITAPATAYPVGSIERRLADAGHPERHRLVDATALASALVGSPAAANVFLLGVAVQAGAVPVSIEALQRAVELNGVSVETNLDALDWGRRWAVDPDGVELLAPSSSRAGQDPTSIVTVADLSKAMTGRIHSITAGGPVSLTALLELLTADLVDYQDGTYATSFLGHVEQASRAERRVAPDSWDLTEAVARNLHKLMAYKDEYEVARLLLLPEGTEAARAVAGEGAEVTWHLHPPMLSALGLDRKLPVGSWGRPAMRALRASKRLRGTRLDPFGRTEMRRLERSLPEEYRRAMDQVYRTLRDDDLPSAIEIARLPDGIRGYESLKLRRADEFRSAMATALDRFSSSTHSGGGIPAG